MNERQSGSRRHIDRVLPNSRSAHLSSRSISIYPKQSKALAKVDIIAVQSRKTFGVQHPLYPSINDIPSHTAPSSSSYKFPWTHERTHSVPRLTNLSNKIPKSASTNRQT